MSLELGPGTEIDRYRLVAPLGEGGMASVWSAEHTELGTPCAIKILHIVSRHVADRMLQEGRIQASLDHPNIVRVHDVVRYRGFPALVMEKVDGPPLDVLLRWYRPSPTQVDALALGILDGVAHAHGKGLIHRDLKPANILVSLRQGLVTPKVTDFGLAKMLGEGDKSNTRTGAALGTPTFMPPEQVRDAKFADERADVFSLGAIFYELVTGVPALRGEDLIGVFEFSRDERWRPVRELVPSAPQRIVDAIETALRADRDQRWPSAAAFRDAWVGDTTPTAAQLASAWEEGHVAELAQLGARSDGATGTMDADGPADKTIGMRGEAPPPSATLDLEAGIDDAPLSASVAQGTADPPLPAGATAVPDALSQSGGPQTLGASGFFEDSVGGSPQPGAEAAAAAPLAEGRLTQSNLFDSGLPTPSAERSIVPILLVVVAVLLVLLLLGLVGVAITLGPGTGQQADPLAGQAPGIEAPEAPQSAPATETEAEAEAESPPVTSKPTAPANRSTPPQPTPTTRVAVPPPARVTVSIPSGSDEPEAVVPAPVSAEPTPPSAPTTATVVLEGASRGSLVSASGKRYALQDAPPGKYTLHVSFAAGTTTPVLELTLRAGDERKVICEPGMRMCR